MRQFWIHLTIILAFTVGIAWINDEVNKRLILASTFNSAYKTYRLFVEQPRDEIGIFGSSRASRHFVPPLISSQAFNYGHDGSWILETLFLAHQAVLNQGKTPIIINIEPWGFQKTPQIVPTLDYRLAFSNPRVRQCLPKSEQNFKEYCPGIRFYGMLRQNLANFINSKRSTLEEHVAGAGLILDSRTPQEWEFLNARIKPSDFTFDESHQMELEKLYAATQRPIILVVGPVSPMYRKQYVGQEKLQAFLAKQASFKNVYPIDLFTTTADWGEAFFKDPTHLNKRGAIRFTQELVEILKRNEGLKDYFTNTVVQ